MKFSKLERKLAKKCVYKYDRLIKKAKSKKWRMMNYEIYGDTCPLCDEYADGALQCRQCPLAKLGKKCNGDNSPWRKIFVLGFFKTTKVDKNGYYKNALAPCAYTEQKKFVEVLKNMNAWLRYIAGLRKAKID